MLARTPAEWPVYKVTMLISARSLHPDRGGVEVLRALCRHDFEVALRLQSGAPLAG